MIDCRMWDKKDIEVFTYDEFNERVVFWVRQFNNTDFGLYVTVITYFCRTAVKKNYCEV